MFRNYFKIGWRSLNRNRSFALTNILGLSLGISSAILIFTIISYHLSFDGFHPGADRIYRVVSEIHYGNIEYIPGVPQPLGKAFRNEFSFADQSARVRAYHDVTISTPGEKEIKKFEEIDQVAFAEPAFFSIFHFPLISGDKNALAEPFAALITQEFAKKYFGREDARGKMLRVNSLGRNADFRVAGILKDIPPNTDRRQQIYLSYPALKSYDPYFASDSSWGSTSSGMHFFIRLRPGVRKDQVEASLPGFVHKYFDAEDAAITQLKLQPLSDMHFNPSYDGSLDKKYLWVLGLIGAFLVFTACVNFINLATAQALRRSREVGIYKALGGRRSQVFMQFITETFLITALGTVLAYGIALLALPYTNHLLSENLPKEMFVNWRFIIFLVLLVGVVISLSGLYPGMILSRFQPVQALKGKISQKSIGGIPLRKGLLVLQFAISQILIMGMIVIGGQMRYSQSSDLGFIKDQVLMVPVPAGDANLKNTLRSRLAALAGVQQASLCYQAPASSSNSFTNLQFDNRPRNEPWEVNLKDADAHYLPALGLKLAAGRNLFPSDTANELLINETAVRKLGFIHPQEVIGKELKVNGGKIDAPIVGVVKDFYNNSFHDAISPIVLVSNPQRYRNCALRINLKDTRQILGSVKKIWEDTYPQFVFSYTFLDDRISQFYTLEQTLLWLVEGFASIAIGIACLGLYGLVSFMAVQKTKEIGIRKVLGASVQRILWLFNREFLYMLLLAFLVASPIAWVLMHQWLEDFVYRIPLRPVIFVLAILLTLVISACTVGYRSLRSALANPVHSLRNE